MFHQNGTNPIFKEFQLSRIRRPGCSGLRFVRCLYRNGDDASRKQRQAAINHCSKGASYHADIFPVQLGAGLCKEIRNAAFQALHSRSVAQNVIEDSFC